MSAPHDPGLPEACIFLELCGLPSHWQCENWLRHLEGCVRRSAADSANLPSANGANREPGSKAEKSGNIKESQD